MTGTVGRGAAGFRGDWSGPIAVALLGAALFSVESWAFGRDSWIYPYGAAIETLPVHLGLSRRGYNFALWAPFIAGGVDRLSFWGNADPLNIEPLLVGLLPIWLANGAHRFLQYFVALLFTSRVLEEEFGLERQWSLLGGWLHGCFAYFTFGEMLAFPGVPLLLWLLDRVIRPGRHWAWALLGGVAFSPLTTFTHSVPYLLAFALLWTLLVRREHSPRALMRFALFSAALMLAELPQFVAVLENARFSHRGNWPAEAISFSIDGLFYRQLQFDYFNQDLLMRALTTTFPGVVLLCGLCIALVLRRRPRMTGTANAFLSVFAVYALLSQRWLMITLQTALGTALPWIKSVYMGRFYTLPAAFLIATGTTLALRMVAMSVPSKTRLRRPALVLVAGFIAFMLLRPKFFLFYPVGVEGWGERNYQVAALERLKDAEAAPFRVASVLPLQPGYAYGQGLETADGWANLYPAVYRDLWLRAIAPVMKKLPRVKVIFDPEQGRPQDHYIFLGADLIYPEIGALPGEDPFEAVRDGFDIAARFNLDILRLINVKYLLSEYPLRAPGIELVHAPAERPTFPQSRSHPTGMTHYLRPPEPETHGIDRWLKPLHDYAAALKRKRHGKDLFVYALTGALPRFQCVEQIEILPNGGALLDRLSAAGIEAIGRTAFVEAADAGPIGGQARFGAGVVRLEHYGADEIDLRIDHEAAVFLVVANTWNPFWRATVDGHSVPLVRVNHAQMGLVVAAGQRRIELRYVPPYAPAEIVAHAAGRR